MALTVSSASQKMAVLERLYPLQDAWDASDDWTGVTGTAERKKRQNRINQRAYRRRKNAQQSSASKALTPSRSTCPSDHEASSSSEPEEQLSDGALILACDYQIKRYREFARQAYEQYTLGAFQTDNLPVLIRLNVLNAMSRNAQLIGIPQEGLCRDEFESPFAEAGPRLLESPTPRASCPAQLQPTTLQRTLRHHPWIDLFPFPQLRDNFLLACKAGLLDEDELCLDMLNVEAVDIADKPALIVWGESSDFSGWEVTSAFLRKWGWLLKGCPELIEASNVWRESRGEKRLNFRTD